MAKEITLEELSMSANQRPAVRAEDAKKVDDNKAEKSVQQTGVKSARPISTSDLGKNLKAQHPEAQKKIVETMTNILYYLLNCRMIVIPSILVRWQLCL